MKSRIELVKAIIFKHIGNIKETKFNHLELADSSEYHHHRYIIEKEKEMLLWEILKEINDIEK